MVCLWSFGGRLISEAEKIVEAARRHSSGDAVSAVAIYRDILKQSPQHPHALHMLGVIAMQSGNSALAISMTEAALAAKPDFAAAWVNRCLLLHGAGRNEEALASARFATQSDSNLAEAWDALALAARACGDMSEAATAHKRSVSLQPDNSHFLGNFADFLLGQGDLSFAYRQARKAEGLSPHWPPMTLGNVLKAMGRPDVALSRFVQTRILRPAFAEATVSESIARLQMADMEHGWRLWEQRPDLSPDLNIIPLWQGQRNAHLLVYEDQGLGDVLHFARYLPWLRERVEKLTMRVAEPLRGLFAENFTGIDFINDDVVPAVHARCRLSSLPFFAGTRMDSIPLAPYLVASETKRILWRERLQSVLAPRIGIVWAGNPAFRGDKLRSLDIEMLHSLFQECGKRHFVSLQKKTTIPSGIYDSSPQLLDFTDTAALMAELDIVIAVDTAAAHLAGALGKPVFILLPFDSDWRWFLGREDSPWYPSARLFRQTKPYEWAQVITALTQEVSKFISGDLSVLEATPWHGECLRQNPEALSLDS